MGYFKELEIDIIDDYYNGMNTADIAKKYNYSVELVSDIISHYDDGQYDADPGEMDGDAESALASAGYGTDEDYGTY